MDAGAGEDVRLSTEERVHDASGTINAASAAPTTRGDLYMLEATRCEPRFRSVCAMMLLISDLQSILDAALRPVASAERARRPFKDAG